MNRYTQLLLLCSGLYFTSDVADNQQNTVPNNNLPTLVNKAQVAISRGTVDTTRLKVEDGRLTDDNIFRKEDFEVKVRGRRSDIFGFIRPASEGYYITGFKSN